MNTTTFHYHVVTNFPQLGGAETELRTHDVRHALDVYLDEVQNGNPTLVMDGYTGEILAIANHENMDDHATDEFALIIRGYLATLAAQEEELMQMAVDAEALAANSLGRMVLTLDFDQVLR